MGVLKSVCISTAPKSSAKNVHQATVVATGISGDIHCRMEEKQISLLPYELVKQYFDEKNEPVIYGRFGENLDVEGLDWDQIKIGDRIYSDDVIMQVTALGIKWKTVRDTYKGDRVCTPMEHHFVYCRVVNGGILTEGEQIDLS